MSDYRQARTDSGFLIGRALGLALHLDHWLTGDPTRNAALALHAEVLRTPQRGVLHMSRWWAAQAREARRKGAGRWAELDAEYQRCLAMADIEHLPERVPDVVLDDTLAAWAAAAVHGYHVERLALAGRQLEDARQVQVEWVEAAKADAVSAVQAGMSEAEAARTVGLDRMTVRKALGK